MTTNDRPYLYAVVEIDREGNKSYTAKSPMSKDEARAWAKLLRRWAKDDNVAAKYKIVRVYLTL